MGEREIGAVEMLTIEDFEAVSEEDAYKVELVRGHIVREPRPGPRHGIIMGELMGRILAFTKQRNLGVVVPDTGFVVSSDPPTVRGPDIAFVRREAFREAGLPERGFWRLAPDLAVEVLSPSNTAGEIQEKVLEYLGAGVRLVWVVDPKTRSVTVFEPSLRIRLLREGDALDGGDVLPGFELPLAELFRVL